MTSTEQALEARARRAARRVGLVARKSRWRASDPNYGAWVNCYICNTPHKALGLARIQDESGTTNVPLCEPCRHDPDGPDAIIWRFWHAPNLILSEGGEATHEQILALAEKQRAAVN